MSDLGAQAAIRVTTGLVEGAGLSLAAGRSASFSPTISRGLGNPEQIGSSQFFNPKLRCAAPHATVRRRPAMRARQTLGAALSF